MKKLIKILSGISLVACTILGVSIIAGEIYEDIKISKYIMEQQ